VSPRYAPPPSLPLPAGSARASIIRRCDYMHANHDAAAASTLTSPPRVCGTQLDGRLGSCGGTAGRH
jgi:hypothetical protein